MKVYISAVLFFSSWPALACPDLSGTYSCEYIKQSEIITVIQEMASGVQIYNIGGTPYIVDGEAHPFTDQDVSGVYTATCSDSAVKIDISIESYDAEMNDFVRIDGQMNFSSSPKGYVQVLMGMARYRNIRGPVYEVNSCKKIN